MNAPLSAARPPLTIDGVRRGIESFFADEAEAAEADRWARVRLVAAAIPADVDLDDDADVIRALFLARFCGADIKDVLTEAIALARDYRKAAPDA